jgi:adenylate cyclase
LPKEERKLAAILAADVAGYSRLMAADESGTLALLRTLRAEVIEPKIVQFHGRIVGSAGDSLLVEFASAVSAVQCAVELQEALTDRNTDLPLARHMVFRMGVNLGDVIAEDTTIHGDGVNIASRLEKLAEPGSVCMARNVYDQVKGKLNYGYSDLGEQRMHNMPEPVHAYRVKPSNRTGDIARGLPTREFPPLPDKPSIAVLPFQNMSGDPQQEYFADGIVEEIITALSRFRQLFVIARNSTFTYKGRAVDVKQVGRELGVRYVLEGSVRKAGSRVRITGQLIDASTGTHLWADRFEGEFEDIFDLQDQVTARVVAAIAPKLEEAEIERAKRKPTESGDAYDQFLRGMAGFHEWSRDGNDEALSHFYRAIQLDPNYAAALGMAARVYVQRNAGGWIKDRSYEVAETERLANRAAELGRDDAVALSTAGFALADILGLIDDGDAMIDRALKLNPNLAWAWLYSSWVKTALGEPEAALERIGHALRLSPNDPQTFSFHAATAYAQLFAGRFADAYSSAETAVRQRPGFLLYMCIAAVSAAWLGKTHDAQRIVSRMLAADPTVRISSVATILPLRRPEDMNTWMDGLRKAGLPE